MTSGIIAQQPSKPIVIRVKTDNPGYSDLNSIIIPAKYHTNTSIPNRCIIDWGDGIREDYATSSTSQYTHTYSAPGEYVIRIYGQFAGFYYSNLNTVDRLKLIELVSLGNTSRFSPNQDGAFSGCSNMIVSANLHPFNFITSAVNIFSNCTNIITLNNVTFENVVNGEYMFAYCTNLVNIPLATFTKLKQGRCTFQATGIKNLPFATFSELTDGDSTFSSAMIENLPLATFEKLATATSMFRNSKIKNLPLAQFNLINSGAYMLDACTGITELPSARFDNLGNGERMLRSVPLTTASYSKILKDLDTYNIKTGVTFNASASKYDSTAVTARANLVARGWTISDSGLQT